MPHVARYQCDGPGCAVTGACEDDDPELPPYGWIVAEVFYMGTVSKFTVWVHDLGCLAPAVACSPDRSDRPNDEEPV